MKKRRNLKIVLLIFIVAILVILAFFYTNFNLQNEESRNCLKSGGKWQSFLSACVDSCDFQRGIANLCTSVLTQGCDCGPNRCWNGTACELNNLEDYKETEEQRTTQKYNYALDTLFIRFNNEKNGSITATSFWKENGTINKEFRDYFDSELKSFIGEAESVDSIREFYWSTSSNSVSIRMNYVRELTDEQKNAILQDVKLKFGKKWYVESVGLSHKTPFGW